MHRKERTSRRVASQAGRILRDPAATSREKTLAGSALSQAPDRQPEQRLARCHRGRPGDKESDD